jgi:hypothetical protein
MSDSKAAPHPRWGYSAEFPDGKLFEELKVGDPLPAGFVDSPAKIAVGKLSEPHRDPLPPGTRKPGHQGARHPLPGAAKHE